MKPATSIEKVCRVLNVLREHRAVGVVQLAKEAGLLNSDAHRILASLRAFGYVEQDIRNKTYRLGLELLKLGHIVYRHLNLGEVAKPLMRKLSEVVDATVNLAILDSRALEIIFVQQVESSKEFQIKMRIGARVTPHATAVGKLLTAHEEPSMALRILKKSRLIKRTRFTITDLDQLFAEFEKIRRLGYATDREEAMEGASCISAPVRDYTGEVVAALSISVMAVKMQSEESDLCKNVVSTAAKISAAMGFGNGRVVSKKELHPRPKKPK
jgi:DNA-binding IclR family transcriptional regulator